MGDEGKINIFGLGEKGVVVAKDPLHVVDGELMQSQNAIANNPDEGIGGLEKRGGMTKLNASALGGAVRGLLSIPLPDAAGAIRSWYWNDSTGGPDGDTKNWRTAATAGTSWGAAEDIFTPPGAAQVDTALPWVASASNYRDVYCASLGGRLYYPGYHTPVYPTAGAQAPVIRVFDGVVDAELCRIPYNYKVAVDAEAIGIAGIYALDDRLFVVVVDDFTGLPNARARVFELLGTTGQLTQIGNSFGPDAGEAAGGVPKSLAWFGGRLWAGTIGGDGSAASQTGLVYSLRPGIDTSWTLDHTTAVGQGHITGMQEYRGDLYVGTSGEAGSAALILKRTPAGVWSTSKTGSKVTAALSPSTYWAGLRVFSDELYAVYFGTDGAGFKTEVHKFDGTTWTTDLDIEPAAAISRWPGMTVVRGDALYVPMVSVSWRMVRKAAGAWTTVVSLAGSGAGSSFLGFVE